MNEINSKTFAQVKPNFKPSWFVWVISALACGGICGPAAHAQSAGTPPNAGSLQQQLEREQQSPTQRLQVKPPGKPMTEPPAVGQTVQVKAFRFEGNTLLTQEQLQAVVAPLLNRPIDFARLQSSAVLVADLYRDQGWVVQTFLPEQDITQGEVRISIVEAVFGQARVTGTPATRVLPEAVLAIFAQQQQSGKFLNMNALDRALLLADDLPGVTVTGTLSPGQQSGQTDLLLLLADEPWLTGNVSADNTGSVSTGSRRANLSLNVNSPTRHGDSLSVSAMATQGLRYGRVGYSLPVGANGWRVGINASRLDYDLISEAYKSLNASGNSTTTGVELSYPLVRSRPFNLSSSLAADQKKYFNVSGGATSSAYRSAPVTLGLSGSSFDALGGGGANAFSGLMTAGRLNLNGSPTQSSDASTAQTAGAYSKVRYALSRQQQMNSSVSLYTAFSGQWARKNLDSSEKFYLGGSGGVRAYPSSEGGGSLGQMLNVELRWQLPEAMSLVGFYDYGRVTQNVNNSFAGAPVLNSFALKGAGVSLNWRHSAGLALQATWARRIGQNPNAITTDVNRGADQDGTLKRNRFWLTASLAF